MSALSYEHRGKRSHIVPYRQSGFTYLGVLLVIAIMGVAMGTVGVFWSTTQQREKETELLFIGNQFRQAIRRYYEITPGRVKEYPRSLTALLKDTRTSVTQTHLRKIFVDPMTNTTDWGLVTTADGGITGVYSLSENVPLKVAGFKAVDKEFEGKQKYSDWRFVYIPSQNQSTGQSPGSEGLPIPPGAIPTPPGALPPGSLPPGVAPPGAPLGPMARPGSPRIAPQPAQANAPGTVQPTTNTSGAAQPTPNAPLPFNRQTPNASAPAPQLQVPPMGEFPMPNPQLQPPVYGPQIQQPSQPPQPRESSGAPMAREETESEQEGQTDSATLPETMPSAPHMDPSPAH